MKLRPYQLDLIERARRSMIAGHRRLIVQAPTGAGKTVLIAQMIKQTIERGGDVWMIVHRKELKEQTEAALSACGVNPDGIVWTIQTLARKKLNSVHLPRLIVWDECHHARAKTYSDLIEYADVSFHIGLTATPCRLDGRGLDAHFTDLIIGPSVSDLIEMGWLSPYRLIAPPTQVDLSGVRTVAGDYNKSQLAEATDKPVITGSAINEYVRYANGKRAIVFAVNVAHSKSIVSAFKDSGISAEHLDGTAPKRVREEIVSRFRSGDIQVLSNCNLFTEGFDVPGVYAVILLRPTKSLGMYMQMVGRGLRVCEGKEHAIIIDHVNGYRMHGLPCEERNWVLKGKNKRSASTQGIKICSNCFSALPVGTNPCSYCRHEEVAPPSEDGGIGHVDGELSEVDIAALKSAKKLEERQCETFDDFLKLGISRGYKHPYGWASHRVRARGGKRSQAKGNRHPERDHAGGPEVGGQAVSEQRRAGGDEGRLSDTIRPLHRQQRFDWMDK